jgi:hypothetical protein
MQQLGRLRCPTVDLRGVYCCLSGPSVPLPARRHEGCSGPALQRIQVCISLHGGTGVSLHGSTGVHFSPIWWYQLENCQIVAES